MVRPVRISIIAISVVLVLFTMQIGVSAKKKSSKRKHRAARNVPVVVASPARRSVRAKVTSPVRRSEPAVVTSPVQRSEPVAVTSPVQQSEPAVVTSPVQESEPVIVTPPVQEREPVIVTAPVQESEPVIVTPPVQEREPVIVTSPVQESEPVIVTTPVLRSLPVIVMPPALSPADANDILVNTAAPVTGSSLGETVNYIGKKPKAPTVVAAGSLVISEFRLQGPMGIDDEFIEIYNDFGADHTVADSGAGTGYAIAASDGIARCIIPNTTVIPARGHYLCVNSVGYSLASYPAGNGITATGDATYTTGITHGEDTDPGPGVVPAPRQGIALFNTSVPANFTLANRFDAVGPVAEANTLYKEGTGVPNLTAFSIDYSYVRDECGKGGSIPTLGVCSISTPKDTDNNSADFFFVDTNGTSAGAGQRLGAPGPQNLASSIQRNSSITENLLDATVARSNPPNRVRDFTSDPGNNSTFGTLSIRRRFVNNTGANVTSLRFRIIDLTTFPAPSGTADLRPRNSSLVVIAGINDPVTCAATGAPATAPCTVSAQGTTIDTPPSQPNGGGFNSSVTAGTVTLATPLANGASINLIFLLGIQQTGNFKLYLNIEALP